MCSALFYFWIFRELQAIDSKESQIFHNRQRNRYNRETGEEIKNSEHVFLEQPFKCVKILFPQIYLKTGRRTTQTRKGTAISNFHEYFVYFVIFYQLDNFMKFYMH